MDIPEALLYTKGIIVLIKSMFGYGNTPAVGLSLSIAPPWQWWLGCSGALSPWSKVDKKSLEKLFCPSQMCQTKSELEIVSAVTWASGCVRSPIWSAFKRLVVSNQGNSANPLQVCNCKIFPENWKTISCSLLWPLICQYSVVRVQAKPPLSQLSLSWKNIISSSFSKVERSKSWPLRNSASLVSTKSKESKTS